ncbi:hypothetical protein HY68_36635 [Streptomyces sp. AcH 505]|uniref:hypothetical protein n=1 Tax=Streptomyces sp. AcH 505 TaxID=352211 RepID=UPI0005920443|nr:hypothetical protein HY68_36635 [Streptomyces sp. AcH 505]
MQELRLTDPDGYTVPDSVVTVPDEHVAQVTDHLLTTTAPTHAAQNTIHGYDARYYRVTP